MTAEQLVIVYRLTRALYSAPFNEVWQIWTLLKYMEVQR
jgi:hypothetical protein